MSKPFITREGYDLLNDELNFLWHQKRPEITQKVSWAASLGDRSENADYQYNKRLLFQIDRRIRFLRKILQDLQIIEFNKQQEGKVFFGAYVQIQSADDDSILNVRLVGTQEILGRANYISVDSPMARAMLGKSVDDEFIVKTPKGDKEWYVNKIDYHLPTWFEVQAPKSFDFDEDSADISDLKEIDEEESKRLEQEYLRSLIK